MCRAAIARAHAITRKARAAVAWVAKDSPAIGDRGGAETALRRVTARSKALWHRTMGTRPKPNATVRDLLKLTAGNRQYDDKAGLASGRSPEEPMASIFRSKSLQYMTVNLHKRSIMFEGNHRRFELLDRARDPADEDITWGYAHLYPPLQGLMSA